MWRSPAQFGRGPGRRIIAPMTQERTRAYGVESPSRGQLLLAAMLCALVALVHSVVSTFQMKRKPLLRDWHTDQARASLPRTKSDTQQQEQLAVPQDSPISLMVSSTRSVRPSNHEGVLTAFHSEPSGSVPPVRVPRAGAGEEWRHRRDLVRGTKSNDASLEPCERPPARANKRAKRTESPCGFWPPAFAGDACESACQSART